MTARGKSSEGAFSGGIRCTRTEQCLGCVRQVNRRVDERSRTRLTPNVAPSDFSFHPRPILGNSNTPKSLQDLVKTKDKSHTQARCTAAPNAVLLASPIHHRESCLYRPPEVCDAGSTGRSVFLDLYPHPPPPPALQLSNSPFFLHLKTSAVQLSLQYFSILPIYSSCTPPPPRDTLVVWSFARYDGTEKRRWPPEGRRGLS